MYNKSKEYKIIHISDLHIDVADYDNDRVFKAFIKDIKKLDLDRGVIAVSGDITSKGNYSENQILEIKKRLSLIKETLPDSFEFIFAPGNHDINLKKLSSAVKNFIPSIQHDSNQYLEDLKNPENSFYTKHLDDYYELVSGFDSTTRIPTQLHTTKILFLDNLKIGFASINSAWAAGGKGESDYGNVLIAERQLDLAKDELADCDLKIVVMHHTFDWISLKEKQLIQNSFSRNFDLLLCGHNHNHQMTNTTSQIGNIIINNTGCLYQSRDYFNGYSILTIDFDTNNEVEKVKIESREYYMQRDEFDVSTRFSHNGIQEIGLKKNSNVSTPLIPISIYERLNNNASKKLLTTSSSIAPKNIAEIFVEPPLARVDEKTLYSGSEIKLEPDEIEKKLIKLDELAKTKGNIVFLGKKESGKTTLLDFLATHKFLEFHNSAIIGLVVDLSIIKRSSETDVNENSILNYIVSKHFDSELSKKQLIDILENGRMLICFDNLNIKSPKDRKSIEKFVEKYKKCRFICGIQEDINNEISIVIPVSINGFEQVIYIHSFKENHTKQLSIKWFDNAGIKNEYNKTIFKILGQLNVPSTPFLISAILWVLEQNSLAIDSKLINQSLVIEVLLDGLLDRFYESKDRGRTDAKIIASFLSELALKLDTDSQEYIPKREFDTFTTKFFYDRSLPQPNNFSNDIVQKGILYESNDLIGFKFDCFRAFYLAKKFDEMEILWVNIIENNLYARYYAEFDFLTGLNRNKKQVLNKFKEKCSEKQKRKLEDILLKDPIQGIDFSFEELEFVDFSEELIEDNSNDSDYEISSLDIPSSTSLDHDKSRQRRILNAEDEDSDWLSVLILYSISLKNGELIDDVDLKLNSLQDILFNWALILVTKLSEFKKINIQEILDSEVFNEIMSEESDGRPSANKEPKFTKAAMGLMLESLLAMAVISIMTSKLATPKLKIVLQNVISSKNIQIKRQGDINRKYEYVKILAFFCLLESDMLAALEKLDSLFDILQKHTLFKNLIFFKLFYLYVQEENESLRNKLKEAILSFQISQNKSKNKRLSNYKAEMSKNLEKNRQKIRNEIPELEGLKLLSSIPKSS